MEGMIGGLDNVQLRQRPEVCTNRPQQLQIRQCVTRPLQEKHWYLHLGQVFSSLNSGLIGRVQRKPKKYQPVHTLEQLLRRSLRSHSAPERFTSRQQGQARA